MNKNTLYGILFSISLILGGVIAILQVSPENYKTETERQFKEIQKQLDSLNIDSLLLDSFTGLDKRATHIRVSSKTFRSSQQANYIEGYRLLIYLKWAGLGGAYSSNLIM